MSTRLIPIFFKGRSKTIGHRGNSVFNRPLVFTKVSRLFADMRPNHASPRALPVLYNCSFLFWGRVINTGTCMHLHFEWSRDSALVLQSLTHSSFSRVSNVVIGGYSFNMNWCGVSGRQEEHLHLSIHNLTWQESIRILVVLWTISKVKLCKSFLKTSKWFVVWLRMTSEFFNLLSHLLRLEKGCSESLFYHLKN